MEREIRRAMIIGMAIGFALGVIWTLLLPAPVGIW